MLLLMMLWLGLAQQVTHPIHLPKLEPPTKDAPPMTDSDKATLRAGIALYNQQRYDEAIAKYQEVLAANPEQIAATYEIALAVAAQGNKAKAIDILLPTLAYRSEGIDRNYALVGSMLDELNEPDEAVKVYEYGINAMPHSGTLYYNKAVTQFQSLHDMSAGLVTLKRGAFGDPSHAATQLLLGRAFLADDLRSPALLALSRFLILEPGTARTADAYKAWYGILQQNLSKNAKGELEIQINPDKKRTEGDLLQLDMQIALSQTATATANQSVGERLVAQWNGLLGVWSKYSAKGDADKMLWRYYMPYFMELRQKNLVEPFVYYVSQNVNAPGIPEWLAAHQDAVQAFVAWNTAYVWPEK